MYVFFLDLVVAYKKLTLEKNVLEETLKASSNYDKDDLSETDVSEVQTFSCITNNSCCIDFDTFLHIIKLLLVYAGFSKLKYSSQLFLILT